MWFPLGATFYGERRILCIVGFADGCQRLLFTERAHAQAMMERAAQINPPIGEYVPIQWRLYGHARANVRV